MTDVMDHIWKAARKLTEHPNVTLMDKLEIMRCIDLIQNDIAFVAPECRFNDGFMRWCLFLEARIYFATRLKCAK